MGFNPSRRHHLEVRSVVQEDMNIAYQIRMSFPEETMVSEIDVVRTLHNLSQYWRTLGRTVVFDFLPRNPVTTSPEPATVAEVEEPENGDPVANQEGPVAENGGVEERDIQHRGRLFPGVGRFAENVVGGLLMIVGYVWVAQMVDAPLLDKIFIVFVMIGLRLFNFL